ncbi:MAG: hypothetical protein Q9182_000988 [Xanthomendoza sp. 2 TL-2023]
MYSYFRSNIVLCLTWHCTILLPLLLARPSNSLPANISEQPQSSSSQPNFLPDFLLPDTKNTTSTPYLRSSGCYKPTLSARRLAPRDAIIALGELAKQQEDFNSIRAFYRNAVLTLEGTAVILLMKTGHEIDYFSIYDIVVQAFHIVDHCILQQLGGEQLGGELEVGTGNKFRVIVRGKMF